MSISPIGSNSYQSLGAGSSGSASAGAGSSSSASAPQDIKFSGYSPSSGSAGESGGAQSGEQPQKSGGIKGFFKGIWNGAKNAVKSLATPKGLLMAAAGVAACIAFPVAAPLVLGGVAVAAGGSQIYKGIKNKDTEQVGEGVFTAGAGVAGVAGARTLTPNKGVSSGTGAPSTVEGASAAAKPSFLSKLNPMNWGKSSAPKTEAAPAPQTPAASVVDGAGTSVAGKSAPLTEANLASHNSTVSAGTGTSFKTAPSEVSAGTGTSFKTAPSEISIGKSASGGAPPLPPRPQAPAAEAGAATTAKPNMFSNALGNLKTSGPAQNFSNFGSAVKNGEGVAGKLKPLAAPATMIPATASLNGLSAPKPEEAASQAEEAAAQPEEAAPAA